MPPIQLPTTTTMPNDIQVISPHRDDAALSLCLAILQWLRDGRTVRMINCFTRSSFSIDHRAGDIDAVSAVRLREDRAFLELLGPRATMTDLGHADYIDRPGWTPQRPTIQDAPLDDNDRREIDALATSLADHLGPGPLLVPSCSGPHRDHLIAVHATQQARAAQPVAVYDDQPYTVNSGRPAAEARVRDFAKRFGLTFSPHQLGDPTDLPTKRAALDAYPSQLDADLIGKVMHDSQRGERVWCDDAAAALLGSPG
ncbi:MAG: PIG-L family deacetylase [Planctomycetota bacterium]